MTDKHLEQWERLKHWYKRFIEINDGQVHNRDSECYKDEIYAFPLNCYHLKDWLKANEKRKSLNCVSNVPLSASLCQSSKILLFLLHPVPAGQDATIVAL